MVKRIIILLFVFSSILSFGQANRFAGFGYKSSYACPVEALNFIDSTVLTDTLQKRAICTLVQQLQDSSLWNTYNTIYPFVGTSFLQNSYNLINPTNSTSAFRINFNDTSTITLSSSGVLFNGTSSSWATTNLNPFTVLTKGDLSLSVLINGGTLGGEQYPATLSASVTQNNDAVQLILRPTLKYFITNGQSNPLVSLSNTATTGLFCGTVKSGTSYLLKDGSVLATATPNNSGSLANINMRIARDPTQVLTSQNVRFGIILIGSGKTPAQAQTEWNIVNQFKTTLGR